MSKRIQQIIGFLSYLVLIIPIIWIIWITKEHYNWITGGLKQVGVIAIWIISIIYLIILIHKLFKKRTTKIYGYTLIGLIFILLICITPIYFYKPFEKIRAKKELEDKVEEIELMYIAWAC